MATVRSRRPQGTFAALPPPDEYDDMEGSGPARVSVPIQIDLASHMEDEAIKSYGGGPPRQSCTVCPRGETMWAAIMLGCVLSIAVGQMLTFYVLVQHRVEVTETLVNVHEFTAQLAAKQGEYFASLDRVTGMLSAVGTDEQIRKIQANLEGVVDRLSRINFTEMVDKANDAVGHMHAFSNSINDQGGVFVGLQRPRQNVTIIQECGAQGTLVG